MHSGNGLTSFNHDLKTLKSVACQSNEHIVPHLSPSAVSHTETFVPVNIRICVYVVYMCCGKLFLTLKRSGKRGEVGSAHSFTKTGKDRPEKRCAVAKVE